MTQALQFEAADLRLRVANDTDELFLKRLFKESRSAEAARWNMDAAQQDGLQDMQYRGQNLTYLTEYPDAANEIIEDGKSDRPIGRHLTARRGNVILGIDLAILPLYQRRGVGSRVLLNVQRLCVADGLCFTFQVLQTNPARRLYERLGFTLVSQDPLFVQMQWNAAKRPGEDYRAPASL